MYRHKIIRYASYIIIVVMVLGVFAYVNIANAVELSSISDTLTNHNISAADTNHTIVFTLSSSGALNNDDTIVLTFASGWDLATETVAEDDVDVSGSILGEATTAADCAGSEHMSVWISDQDMTITICNEDGGDLANSETVTIEIGSNATSSGTGSNNIVNPGTAGPYSIDIETKADGSTVIDNGALAVPIVDGTDVDITATVDPTLTATLSDTTCGMGDLDITGSEGCSYSTTVSTNVTNGFTSYIAEASTPTDSDGCSSGTDCDIEMIGTPANTISDGDGTLDGDSGNEDYGVITSDSGNTVTNDANCAQVNETYYDDRTDAITVTTLTNSEQDYSAATGPVSSDVTYICHVIAVSATTEAGSYQHTVRVTTVGNF